MEKLKNFFRDHANIVSAFIAIIISCSVMTLCLIPYRLFWNEEQKTETDFFSANALALSRPVGITYELERDLLARFISHVAENEPYNAQVSVGAVVINRCRDAHFPHDIPSVIAAFTPYYDKSIADSTPSARSIHAARDAMLGIDPTGDALYFFSKSDTALSVTHRNRITVSYGSLSFYK